MEKTYIKNEENGRALLYSRIVGAGLCAGPQNKKNSRRIYPTADFGACYEP